MLLLLLLWWQGEKRLEQESLDLMAVVKRLEQECLDPIAVVISRLAPM
jgi:hypothetical protein